MPEQKVPLAWIVVFVAICVLVGAILLTSTRTQPESVGNFPGGLESSDSPRVQTFEEMLRSGENAVFVENQAAGSWQVAVGVVALSQPGFLVIHANDGGLPGRVMGSSPLMESGGEHFFVPVDRALEAGAIYYAMLYLDSGDGQFHPNVDHPALDAEQSVVLMTFTAAEGAEPETGIVIP